MGKNYDNWERLVTAVLRRERDRHMALNHSRDPSSISSGSSTSQFDYDQPSVALLPTDDSDLTPLHHHQWKEMLPPDKRVVVWRSASLSFYLDQRTGKNCFLLGAKKLVRGSRDGFNCCWVPTNCRGPESRFDWAAKLLDSRHLYIECNIKSRMLSPETLYAAYLIFASTETCTKLHSAVSIIRDLYDESGYEYPDEQARMVQFRTGCGREDGWMEIELAEFYVNSETNGEVQVQLLDTSGYRKSGLIVEGIEFRPLKGEN